jgi:hypothetical protein
MSLQNTTYHLLIEPLNLYPSLADNPVQMLEQVMNGVLLVSSQNLQAIISEFKNNHKNGLSFLINLK